MDIQNWPKWIRRFERKKMDRNDERIKRALRRRPYVLKPVRVNTPDSVLWPTGKVHRRPKPPIIVCYGQDQTSGDGWSINPEPLSQSGRVTRLMERKYDVTSSSSSDDFSIYSFTDCESECHDEDHERRTPPLKVEDGKVTKLEVSDMVEDDDLSLHSYDESDFLLDDGNDASPEPPNKPQGPLKDHRLVGIFKIAQGRSLVLAEALRALPSAVAPPSPENVPRPLTPLSPVIIALPTTEKFPYRRSSRLAPITNLSETVPTGERKYKKGILAVSPSIV
ncbi:uncharacterized protein LOC115148717 isoform X2 [Salmo trutta]|uniref:uncharacterized protein LOC115148717 isoform X2 n=1 Tax=Salmo trutta TaxID=8032 RepID=UPI0011315EF2|nr:uncharacterized protein LOC115148717 isoform X2 [Salmo trutta]